MAGIIESFKKGYRGDDTERFSVAGSPVRCSHCGGQDFAESTAMLNTPGMTLVGLDWANRTATVLVCATCGHVEWFVEVAEPI